MKSLKLIAAAAALLGASFASAGTTSVDFHSTSNLKGLGAFTGTATYDSSTDKLTMTLDNTSATKSVITGFAFDLSSPDKAKAEKTGHWKDDRNHKGIVKAKPYGNYEAGAALGGVFGHSASKFGIANGAEKTFVFDVTGSTASTLTASDFFSGPAGREIVANFAGFKHHKTDRAAGVMVLATSNTTNNNPFPIDINPGGKLPGDGGIIQPPNGGGPNGGPKAVPLPSAGYAGFMMLSIMGALAARKRLAAMFV